MKKYILLLGILLGLYSIVNAQPLSVKWNNSFVEDSMNIPWIRAGETYLDKNQNLLLLLENSWRIPAFLYFNGNGDRLFYQNYYFKNNDEEVYPYNFRLSPIAGSACMIVENELNDEYFRVVTISQAIEKSHFAYIKSFELAKDDNFGFGSLISEYSEDDILLNPKTILKLNGKETYVFTSYTGEKYYYRVSDFGKILDKYELGVDDILSKQAVITASYDIDTSRLIVLSGYSGLSRLSKSNVDSIFGFQLRFFVKSSSNNSFEPSFVLSYKEQDFGIVDRYLLPNSIIVKDDVVFVAGMSELKSNDGANNSPTIVPFFIQLDKKGAIINSHLLTTPMVVNSVCISKDGTKLAFGGQRSVTDVDSQIKQCILTEIDITSLNEEYIVVNQGTSPMSLSNVKAYENGDYSFTTYQEIQLPNDTIQRSKISVGRITHSTTSVDETKPKYKTTVRLEPNPTNEYATVRFLVFDEMSQVNLVDSKGMFIRNIYTKDVGGSFESSVTFRVSDLANGMYYVVVGNGTTTLETVPLSIQR